MERKSGWKGTLRRHGPALLSWLEQNNVLAKRLDTLARVLNELLVQRVTTSADERAVWDATPAVLTRCNEQSTYSLPGASVAYAWLHLLDRYARTWSSLERLVDRGRLPMTKHGVRTLDVGTGPGPSAFAIHDFYMSLVEYAKAVGRKEFRQPPELVCVELDHSSNYLRHVLAEYLYEETGRESQALLSLCGAHGDFKAIDPNAERARLRDSLRWQKDEYYDEARQMWVGDSWYTDAESNDMAQALHRYRLIVFSNFLTTVGSVREFEGNIREVLTDARPGTVALTLGGKAAPYPEIYEYVTALAEPAGFRLELSGEEVSSAETVVAGRVYEAGQRFFRHLQSLAPLFEPGGDEIGRVHAHFARTRAAAPTSQIWAYRKYSSPRAT